MNKQSNPDNFVIPSQGGQSPSLLQAAQLVAGLQVGPNWLTQRQIDPQGDEKYRAHLHLAFEKAQLRYNQRKSERLNKPLPKQENEKINARISEIERKEALTPKLLQEYKTNEPEFPDLSLNEKLKLVKLSRGCSKKQLERYFHIDPEHQTLVYYGKPTDSKPKKSVSLDACKVVVERLQKFKSLPEEEQKSQILRWADQEKAFRVKISTSSRKFQPVFHYTDSFQSAVIIKAMIDRLYTPEDVKKQMALQMQLVMKLFRIQVSNSIYTGYILKVSQSRRQKMGMLKNLEVISRDFQEIEKPQMLSILDNLGPLKKAPAEPPKLKSTLKFGKVHPDAKDKYFKSYSKLQRVILGKLQTFIKDRMRTKPHYIKDQVQHLNKQHTFTISKGRYLVNDQLLNGLSKLPQDHQPAYPLVSDMQQLESILTNDQSFFIIKDKRGKEHKIPWGEMCFMAATNGNRVELRGRKINANLEIQGENILPSQVGLERVKQSRLNTKQVIKLGFRNITLPKQLTDQLQSQVYNDSDHLHYRLRLDVVGTETYLQTPFFTMNNKQEITLSNQDMELDHSDLIRTVKVSLISVKSRSKNSPMLHELAHETLVASTLLNIKDLLNKGGSAMQSLELQLNMDKNNAQIIENNKVPKLNANLSMRQVNGAYETCPEPEGPQLLVGRYALLDQKLVVRVLQVNRSTCNVEVLDTQPWKEHKLESKTINGVNIAQRIRLIERYGISIFGEQPPQNYSNGQYEWSLDLQVNDKQVMQGLLDKIHQGISNYQVRAQYHRKIFGKDKAAPVIAKHLCGKLQITVVSAHNLQNSQSGIPCDTFVRIIVPDLPSLNPLLSDPQYQDLQEDGSFIESTKPKGSSYQTPAILNTNNPSWINTDQPSGHVLNLTETFMSKLDRTIQIEVHHQKKKSMFGGQSEDSELIGRAEIHSDQLVDMENLGQEIILFLENGDPQSQAFIKLRSLFLPSQGSLKRLKIMAQMTFKSPMLYLFHKNLLQASLSSPFFDQWGYHVPIVPPLELSSTLKPQQNETTVLVQGKGQITQNPTGGQYDPLLQRLHRVIPSLLAQKQKEQQLLLSHQFGHMWVYAMNQPWNKALKDKQKAYWEMFVKSIIESPDFNEQGLIDDELRSVRTLLTNTTNMMSVKYKRRNRLTAAKPETDKPTPSSFSAQFVGQWERHDSWKYIDIWHLTKNGMPDDLRVTLWRDFLRRQIHEHQAHQFIKHSRTYDQRFNDRQSIYTNLKTFSQEIIDSPTLFQQIESDIKHYQFPDQYLGHLNERDRHAKYEEQRLQIMGVLRAYSFWAVEFSQQQSQQGQGDSAQKVLAYNNGMIGIIQRLLSLMSEEDAFWTLLGLVKGLRNFFTYEYKLSKPEDTVYDKYEAFCPYTNRKVCLKNEMIIIQAAMKVHFPQVFRHLKSLSVPIEWYFYESMQQFFSNCFPSEMVLRLWDMIVLNIATSHQEQRKRALWYILIVPLYMIWKSNDSILQCTDPLQIKKLLLSSHINSPTPNDFLDDIITLIKKVFVIRTDMFNRLFKQDEANQLEKIRTDVEKETLYISGVDSGKTRKMARFMVERGVNIGMSASSQSMAPLGLQNSLSDVYTLQIDDEVKAKLHAEFQRASAEPSQQRLSLKTLEVSTLEQKDRDIQNLVATLASNIQQESITAFSEDQKRNFTRWLYSTIQALSQIESSLDFLKQDVASNPTQQLLKLLFFGQKLPLDGLINQLFTIFKPMSVKSFTVLLQHLFYLANYPLTLNEVQTLVNFALMEQSSMNITKVTQKVDNQQDSAGNLFSKMFASGQDNVQYEVTTTFRETLNAVIRQTGLIDCIDFSLVPFNTIDFWLGAQTNISGKPQTLTICITDHTGQELEFPISFNASGIYIPSKQGSSSRLPLQLLVSHASLTPSEGISILRHYFPMFVNIFGQDLFLKQQLSKIKDMPLPASQDYEVNYQTAEGHLFKIRFSSQEDKSEDFTIGDTEQLMRLANGNIGRMYRKVAQNRYEVTLSGVSKQNTFIVIKERIQKALKLIADKEGLDSSVPQVLSELFQFRKPGTDLVYASLDRIGSVTSDTSFELVRVPAQSLSFSKPNGYALFTHPSGKQQWRPCFILDTAQNHYQVTFTHTSSQKQTLPKDQVIRSDQTYEHLMPVIMHQVEKDPRLVESLGNIQIETIANDIFKKAPGSSSEDDGLRFDNNGLLSMEK